MSDISQPPRFIQVRIAATFTGWLPVIAVNIVIAASAVASHSASPSPAYDVVGLIRDNNLTKRTIGLIRDNNLTKRTIITDNNDNISNNNVVVNNASNSTISDEAVSVDDRMAAACVLYEFLVYTVLVGFLCVCGLIGNIVTFIVFWRDTMKTSTSFLLQFLSVIDIVLLVTVMPIYCLPPFIDQTGWYVGYRRFALSFVLVYVLPVAWFAQTSTVWVTVLVAANRYIAVCRPYQAARLCTVAQARRQLAVVLLFALAYNVPKFIEGKLEVSVDENGTWTAEADYYFQDDLYFIIYGSICYTIFMLLLPLLALGVLNVRLVKTLSAIKEKRAQMTQSLRQQQDTNVTLVLVVVIIVFSFCQIPALINQVLLNTLKEPSRRCGGFQFFFRRFCNMLVVLNSAVSFVIYVIFNTRFRHVLLEMLCEDGRGSSGVWGGSGGLGGSGGGADRRRLQSTVGGGGGLSATSDVREGGRRSVSPREGREVSSSPSAQPLSSRCTNHAPERQTVEL